MKPTKYTVLIVPDNSENNRSFQITRKGLRRLIILFSAIVISLIAVFWYYGPKVLSYQELEARQMELLSERTKVLELTRELNNFRQMNSFVRQSLGADITVKPETGVNDTSGGALENPVDPRIYISYSENIPSVLPVDGFITSDMDYHSVFSYENHYGLDIAIKEGDPVKAAASGYVVYAGWTYNMGNYIIIYHGDDYFTIYGHNQRNLVEQREYVRRGEVIAQAGNTGLSSGPHLHFEIWKEGRSLDPKIYFPQWRDKNVSKANDG